MHDIYSSWPVQWILNFLQVQLFLTLISWPVLIAWGLPISLLSPLGNLVFTPFLTIFLLVSSFIYFTELLGVPNNWLVFVLEYTAQAWSWCVSWGTEASLYTVPCPSYFVLLLLPLLGVYCLMRSRITLVTIGWLFGLCLCVNGYIWYSCKPGTVSFQVSCGKTAISVVHGDNSIVLLDEFGLLVSSSCSSAWCDYTLIPELHRRLGSSCCHAILITHTPHIRAFSPESLMDLCKKVSCRRIIMAKNEQISVAYSTYFDKLAILAAENNIKIEFMRESDIKSALK